MSSMYNVMRFNSAFKAANSTKARYRVLLGSAGSGKSVNVAQDYIVKLSDPRFTGCSLMVVRSAEVTHANSTFSELLAAINRAGLLPYWKISKAPLQLENTLTGNQIIFRGCNDVRALERLKSVTVAKGKICWVWIEEATELTQDAFEIIDDRLRGELPPGLYYQITLTFNPVNAQHWIKRTLWDYADGGNIFRLRTTYLDNRFIDEDYKARMKRRKEVDPEGYQIYGLGQWGETGGLVFTNYQIESYADRQFDFYSVGCDWGFNHATVAILFGWKDDEPYAVAEAYTTGKTTTEFIKQCEDAGIPSRVLWYCDSAEPDRIKELKQHGYRAQPVTKEPGSVHNQITWLKERIIHVDPCCVNLIRELQQYRYIKDKTTGKYTDDPVPVEDDCIAALRYGIEPIRKSQKLKTMKKGVLGL